jgi:Zn-dependent peptidase ImmA (M78 family)
LAEFPVKVLSLEELMSEKAMGDKFVAVEDLAAYLGLGEKTIRMRISSMNIEKHHVRTLRGHKMCQVNAVKAEDAKRIIHFYRQASNNIISVEDLLKDGD